MTRSERDSEDSTGVLKSDLVGRRRDLLGMAGSGKRAPAVPSAAMSPK